MSVNNKATGLNSARKRSCMKNPKPRTFCNPADLTQSFAQSVYYSVMAYPNTITLRHTQDLLKDLEEKEEEDGSKGK